MVEHAICFRCGEEKPHPIDSCGCCKVAPATPEERAKSLYLSEYRYSEGDQMEKWLTELEAIALRLHAGESIAYDEAELKRMGEFEAKLKALPASAPWKALFRFFLPGLIVLVVVWCLYFLIRTAR